MVLDFFTNFFNAFISIMKTFGVADVLDIAIIAFLIYSVIKLVRETRAEQLVKGLLILVVAWLFSTQFHLKMLSSLLNNFFQFTVLALLVVFQPELRRALEQIGRSRIGKYWSSFNSPSKNTEELIHNVRECIRATSESCASFARSKTGALIVFERATKLGEIIDTGTIIDAKPSEQMIGNVFFNKAPLHDGAMIVRDGMLHAAGCILPLTKNDTLSVDLGTRHRAAVGISENSDAVVVIVSEETGTISMAINGVIKRNFSKDTLYKALADELLPKEEKEQSKKTIIMSSFKGGKKDE